MSDFVTKEQKETAEYIYKYSGADYTFEDMYESSKSIAIKSRCTFVDAFEFLVGFLNTYCDSDIDKKVLIDHAQDTAIHLFNLGLAGTNLDFVRLGICRMFAVTESDFLKLKAKANV
jgi:hypothetical protein